MKAVYLTGFMGAGKTTIGKLLADELHVPVMDTDDYIEKQIGKTIPEIFAEDGENAFRRYEREYIKQLATTNIVITTGGGFVIQQENRDWMKQHGIVIFLYCDMDEMFNRVKMDGSRPLLNSKDKEKPTELFNNRLAFYQEADYTIDTTDKGTKEIVSDITEMLKNQ